MVSPHSRLEVLIIKKHTQSSETRFPSHQNNKLGKMECKRKVTKGQKGRLMFTPFHTSTEAWRGFCFCDPTGREHTQEKKKGGEEVKRQVMFYCIDHRAFGQLYVNFMKRSTAHQKITPCSAQLPQLCCCARHTCTHTSITLQSPILISTLKLGLDPQTVKNVLTLLLKCTFCY